jgi:hypothetical protein
MNLVSSTPGQDTMLLARGHTVSAACHITRAEKAVGDSFFLRSVEVGVRVPPVGYHDGVKVKLL